MHIEPKYVQKFRGTRIFVLIYIYRCLCYVWFCCGRMPDLWCAQLCYVFNPCFLLTKCELSLRNF